MKKVILVVVVAILAISFSQKKAVPADMAITHVTLIDGTGTKAQHDMAVLITKDAITAIKSSKGLTIAPGTKVIDGTGKFLIPGLWDMHVHFSADSNFCALAIANGVTSVRDMFSNRESFGYQVDFRKKVNENRIIGPHMYIPLAVMGPDQNWFSSIKISSQQQAIDFVREVKDRGADFIKVFDLFDPDVFMTLLKEAKKNGIRVAGHVPLSVNAADAAEAGLGTIEHAYEILLATSSNETELRNNMLKEAEAVHTSFPDLSRLLFFVQSKDLLPTYDAAKASQLFKRLKESGSYQCPTLAVFEGKLKAINSDNSIDERKIYVTKECLQSWTNLKENQFSAALTTADFDKIRPLFKKRFDLVNEFNKHNIPILAGTDVGSGCSQHYLVPGFSLHDELMLLTQAGLSPMEALQAATQNGAKALGVINKTGTIELGKMADMVLLDANPLENINNTRKINAVVKAGRYFSREDLNQLLSMVEKRVKP
ncbi:MAG: amidohydrolase family protein [Candidatus Dadabacteria bacterium]